jgi:hypothetical protein
MSTALEQVEYVSIERAIAMRRVWAMPNKNTFDIPPIRTLVKSYLHKSKVSVDPFARNKRWATYTNDLNPETAAERHLDAGDFLQRLVNEGVIADLVIFDPPYSPRQVKEVYETVGKHFGIDDQWNTGRWTKERELVAQLQPSGGIAISCGWNSQGIGLQNGYELVEQLNVCHGGAHNDTIVTVERKAESLQNSFCFGL